MKKLAHLIIVLVAALVLSVSAPAQTKSGSKSAAKTSTAKKPSASSLIDINSATAEQLDALPGVGKVYSKNIVDHRPYRAKNELKDKHIIPASVYDKIRDQIIAKQK